MEYQFTQLDNGLRIITLHRPGTRTAACRFFVRAGSRYDDVHPGLAHFTEHMLFGGRKHIFGEIESRGGELNAHTGREYLSLHTVTLGDDLHLALNLLSELVLSPNFDATNFLNEKLVVTSELEQTRDRSSVIYDLFQQHMWGAEHPFGKPVIGTPEGIAGLELAHIRAFYRTRFVSGNALLAICGDVSAPSAQSLAAETFANFPAGPEQPPAPLPETPGGVRGGHLEFNTRRSYLLVGVPTQGLKHRDRSVLKIIERVLGMGASGRLYRRLREDLGLVYNVNMVSSVYEDAGFLAAHAACAPEDLTAVQDVILDEWADLRENGLSEGELRAAKGNYAGTLARRFETNLSVAGIYGIEGLLHEIEPFEAAIARINRVTPEGVRRAAQTYLTEDRHVITTVGGQ